MAARALPPTGPVVRRADPPRSSGAQAHHPAAPAHLAGANTVSPPERTAKTPLPHYRQNHWRDNAQKAARIKLLHVLVRQHDMDDADYRTWLHACTGHTSSTQCTLEQLSQCIDRLKGKASAPVATTDSPVAPAGLEAQFGKIAALLQAQGKPWAYAEAIAKRMHRKERVQFCTGDELRGVIAALVSAGKRTGQNIRYGSSGRHGQ